MHLHVYCFVESVNFFNFLLNEYLTSEFEPLLVWYQSNSSEEYSLDVAFIQIMAVGILGILVSGLVSNFFELCKIGIHINLPHESKDVEQNESGCTSWKLFRCSNISSERERRSTKGSFNYYLLFLWVCIFPVTVYVMDGKRLDCIHSHLFCRIWIFRV